MKFSTTIVLLVSTVSNALAQQGGAPPGGMPKGGGAKGSGVLGGAFNGGPGGPAVTSPVDGGLAKGPLKSGYFEDPSLPKHTIFAPINPPPGLKLPVMIWGNGACSSNGTLFKRSLWEVASRGFFAIANGAANGGGGQTTYQMQLQALDWVEQNAGKGKWANVDKTRIAVAGQSCGGLETYRVATDKRVSHIGIFNSGEFTEPASTATAAKITKPIFYFLGGPSDIAYNNGERDYKLLKNVPRWKGNLPVGHMATWSQTNGGKFGEVEWKWLDWVLRGNPESAKFFVNGGAKTAGWDVVMADMDNMPKIEPIEGQKLN